MMCPKPVRKEKEKKPYNSLQSRKKERKPLPEWKQHLFDHHESKPSTKDRGDFPRKVIEELITEADGKCQCCKTNPDTTTHHVYPRGRTTTIPGRGVKTNGLRCCWPCHDQIQTNEEELQKWIEIYRVKYGERFWYDEQDWQEYKKKQTVIREADEEKRQRMDELEPIVTLISAAAGRKLKATELRILEALDPREAIIFARMMQDVVGGLMLV